jgi:hypothetical protein
MALFIDSLEASPNTIEEVERTMSTAALRISRDTPTPRAPSIHHSLRPRTAPAIPCSSQPVSPNQMLVQVQPVVLPQF